MVGRQRISMPQLAQIGGFPLITLLLQVIALLFYLATVRRTLEEC
jgi:hypothetical protein